MKHTVFLSKSLVEEYNYFKVEESSLMYVF